MQASHLPLPESPAWSGTDRYSVVRKVGEGGMGVVYEAIDRDTASDRRPEDPAALRSELALPVQAGVPGARGRAPPQPGAPSRARSAGSGPALLHDGARRGHGLPRLRARGRRRSTEPDPYFARRRGSSSATSVTRQVRSGPEPCRWLLPRLWATSRRASTPTGSVRRCANSCKAWVRCTPPASCTGTSSHRTSW